MSGMEEIIDLLEAGFVILIISIVISISWMSTYVPSQPGLGLPTTVLLVQQESTGSDMNSSSNLNGNTTGTDSSQSQSAQSFTSGESNITQNSNVSNSDEVETEQNNQTQSEDSNLSQNSKEQPITSSNNNEDILNNVEKKDIVKSEDGKCTNEIESNTKPQATDSSPQTETVDIATSQNASDEEQTGSSSSENLDSVLRKRLVPNTDCENKPSTSVQVQSSSNVKKRTNNEDSIRIRLKFLDDTQRHVQGKLTELVGQFKRAHFQIELSTNCAVRLIFNGQLLNSDTSTLGHYGLVDNCVVHCYVGSPQSEIANTTNSRSLLTETDEIDFSEILVSMMSPLLLILVAFLWYLRYEYSNIFNTSATIILICLTALLLISQYALTITFNISLGFNSNSTTAGGSPDDSSNDSPPTVEEAAPPPIAGPSTNSGESISSNELGESSSGTSASSPPSQNVNLEIVPEKTNVSQQSILPNRTLSVS